MSNQASIWVSLAAAAISATSALIAFFSYRLAKQTLRLNRQLADRRQPRLVLSFQQGYIKKSGVDTVYALLVAISNPTDIDNSVAHIDLRIDYRPPTGFCARVDVPVALNSIADQNDKETSTFVPPVRVSAHQTAIGWVRFKLDPALLVGCKIDAYTVIVRDSHDESSSVEISVLHEVVDGL